MSEANFLNMAILENINNPQDLKLLSITQLPQLAQEIREYIIDTVSHTGGHPKDNSGKFKREPFTAKEENTIPSNKEKKKEQEGFLF